jgi:hypothetical protein
MEVPGLQHLECSFCVPEFDGLVIRLPGGSIIVVPGHGKSVGVGTWRLVANVSPISWCGHLWPGYAGSWRLNALIVPCAGASGTPVPRRSTPRSRHSDVPAWAAPGYGSSPGGPGSVRCRRAAQGGGSAWSTANAAAPGASRCPRSGQGWTRSLAVAASRTSQPARQASWCSRPQAC